MANQRLLQISGGVILAVAASLALKAYFHSQERSEELIRSRGVIEQALVVSQDYGEALRLSIEAIESFPDDVLLRLYQGQAYHGRGRYTQAIESFDRAAELNTDPELAERIRFYTARSRTVRFLDTGEREDFNLAEGDLALAADGLEFPAAAKMLLGMMLARPSPQQNEARALRLLEEGLAEDPSGEGVVDLDRVRRVTEELRRAAQN